MANCFDLPAAAGYFVHMIYTEKTQILLGKKVTFIKK
jgi:hypothetical protein